MGNIAFTDILKEKLEILLGERGPKGSSAVRHSQLNDLISQAIGTANVRDLAKQCADMAKLTQNAAADVLASAVAVDTSIQLAEAQAAYAKQYMEASQIFRGDNEMYAIQVKLFSEQTAADRLAVQALSGSVSDDREATHAERALAEAASDLAQSARDQAVSSVATSRTFADSSQSYASAAQQDRIRSESAANRSDASATASASSAGLSATHANASGQSAAAALASQTAANTSASSASTSASQSSTSAANAANSSATASAAASQAVSARNDAQGYATVAQNASAEVVSTSGVIQAKYSVKVDINGYIVGYGLIATANNAAPSSQFILSVDNFLVAKPGLAGGAPQQMLEVGQVNGATKLVFRGDMYADGSIAGRSLNIGGAVNLAYNPEMRSGLSGRSYWVQSGESLLEWSVRPVGDQWAPLGMPALNARLSGTPNGAFDVHYRSADASGNNIYLPVVGGRRYEWSISSQGAANTFAAVIVWYDQGLNYITEIHGNYVIPTSNANGSIDGWARSAVFGTAPSGAAFAMPFCRSTFNGSASQPYVMQSAAFFGVAGEKQTTPTKYTTTGATMIDGGQVITRTMRAQSIIVQSITTDEIAINGVLTSNIKPAAVTNIVTQQRDTTTFEANNILWPGINRTEKTNLSIRMMLYFGVWSGVAFGLPSEPLRHLIVRRWNAGSYVDIPGVTVRVMPRYVYYGNSVFSYSYGEHSAMFEFIDSADVAGNYSYEVLLLDSQSQFNGYPGGVGPANIILTESKR